MAARVLILAALFSTLVAASYGEITQFSKLPKVLTVSASPSKADLIAAESKITVTWAFDNSLTKIDTSSFKTVKVKLCYTKESQKDRPWRFSNDELIRDKTCQHDITSKPYSATNNSFEYTVKEDVPLAVYFVRAYVIDGAGKQVAYGENMDIALSVTPVSGRTKSLDIASGVFSAFSVISLAFFFYLEKRKAKRAT